MAGRGFRVTFKVPEIAEELNKIRAYDGKSRLRIEEAVAGSTKSIGRGSRQRAPKRSGKLSKRIVTRFNRKGPTGTIAARTPYAHLPEFGAKATKVARRRKKAMTIGGGSYGPLQPGQTHFATKANIPARKARPYMRPAFEDEKPNLIRNIKGAVQP